LVTDPAVAPAGPCVPLTHQPELTAEQQAELTAQHVTLAMSYGAFDWLITKNEATEAFHRLAELPADVRARAVALLTAKTRTRLRTHLTADLLRRNPDLAAALA
jgi:hypothetical protein